MEASNGIAQDVYEGSEPPEVDAAERETEAANEAASDNEAALRLWQQEVLAAEAAVQRAAARVAEQIEIAESAKDKLKGLRGEYAEAVNTLREAVRGQRRLGFPDEPRQLDAPQSQDTEPADTDEAWRDTSVESLGLPETTCELLREAGLNCVGDIADFTSDDHMLTDVPGIGPAKAERIEKALDAFWEKYRSEVEVEEPADDDGDGDDASSEEEDVDSES